VALVEGCKHSIEITVPVAEIEQETERVVAEIQKKAKLPGFRPGHAPLSIVKTRFAGDIRQDVLEKIVPRAFRAAVEKDRLQVVGSPDISDVHFHSGEPLKFKAEFEVAPEFDLGDYRGIVVNYSEPEVSDEEVNKRIDEIREQKAEYVNEDPRPLADGDYALISLESLSGVAEKVQQDELMIKIGDEATLSAFTDNLRGASPEESREFDVTYPEDYERKTLAGKTVRFHATVKGVRRKELPEANDEFAKDLGDYRDIGEVREAIRKGLFAQRQHAAQTEAKEKIIDKLVDAHEFPVPEVFIERQIESRMEQSVRAMVAEGVDPRGLKLDWQKVRETQRDKALREVKASMLLSRIAEREAIHATRDEVDREVEKIARQNREPVAAAHMRFEKDGTLGRIANHIQTEKTLNFLFEHARKTA